MELTTLITYAQDGLIGIAVILLGMIKIPKIEINLWSFLAKKLGKALNGEVLEQVKDLRKDFDDHVKNTEEERARAARYRILTCEGELRRGIQFTKEAYDELLEDIKRYNHYCATHEDFENYKAVLAIDYILETYTECTRENSFLV